VAPFGTAAFAQACLAIPSGVVALQSALTCYQLTTQIASGVEVAVPRRVARKRVDIPLTIVQMPLSRFAWQVESLRSEAGDWFRIVRWNVRFVTALATLI
jgi:predicted transcriptional regulator of viral defense system